MAKKYQSMLKERRSQEKTGENLISKIKNRGMITEAEVNLLRRRLNNNKLTYEDVEVLNDIRITPEQTKKGLDWLMKKWKTPRGIVRKNNPFGYREENVLENFKEFRLNSFTNNNNAYMTSFGINNWIAVWDVIATDGSAFQYIMEGGMPKIIG